MIVRMTESQPTRWDTELIADTAKWQGYVDRFTALHESGADADGEARFIDALADRESNILDGGCGAGRVGAYLHSRGHHVVGVDKDAGHIDIGRSRYPGLPLLSADLLELDAARLSSAGVATSYDIVVLAGNVMVYLAPGTERDVLRTLVALLKPGGRLVTGFAAGREYTAGKQDTDAAAIGLRLEQRFGTWQLGVHDDSSDWSVSVYRK